MSLISNAKVAVAVQAGVTHPVTTSELTAGQSKWYTEDMIAGLPRFLPASDDRALLLSVMRMPNPDIEALTALVLNSASQLVSKAGEHFFAPVGPIDPRYEAVRTRAGPYAGLPQPADAEYAAMPLIRRNCLAFSCLVLVRGVCKNYENMTRMSQKAVDLYNFIYSANEQPFVVVPQADLKTFCSILRQRSPLLNGVLVGAILYEGAHPRSQFPDEFSVLNAAVLLPLRYHGLGGMTMLMRVLKICPVDISSLIADFQGSVYAAPLVAVIHIVIVYMTQDDATRAALRAAYMVEASSPDALQRYWEYCRIFNEDCLGLVASKNNDTLMSFCLRVYNALSAGAPIVGYRTLRPGIAAKAETEFVDAFLGKYAAGLVGGAQGSLTKAVAERLTGDTQQTVPVANPQPQPAANAAVVVLDDDDI